MKHLATLAVVAALTACGSPAQPTADSAETPEAVLDQTATGDMTGTYQIEMADGSITMQTIASDGSYVETTPDGTVTERGTWRAGDEGTMCFDPAGNDPEACYAGGAPGEDGRFEARDAEGNVASTVRKVDLESETAATD